MRSISTNVSRIDSIRSASHPTSQRASPNRLLRSTLVLAALLITACGGGGGGGNDPAPSPPSQGSGPPSSTSNVAGEWNVVERINSSCGDAEFNQYSVTVTQSGSNLTVIAGGQSFSGTIQNNAVSWTGSFPEDGGTTTITAMNLVLSGDGNTLTGTSTWKWSAPNGDQCEGTTQVTAERAEQLDTTPPTVPTGLRISKVTSTGLLLEWTAATDDTGVSGYRLHRNGQSLRVVTGTQADDSGLKPLTRYCYRVSAVDAANNESERSSELCETTALASDTTPPSAPTALVAGPNGSRIDLSWTAATDNVGVTGYKLYRNAVLLTTVSSTTATDSSASTGVQYCYEVSAIDAAGNESARSLMRCATIPAPTDTTPPSAPTNLTTTRTSTTIALKWNAATDNVGVVDYKIYRNGNFLKFASTPSSSDTRLTPNTQYCYEVTALDAAGNESIRSTQRCDSTLLAGPSLTAPSTASGTFKLSWTFQWSTFPVANNDGYRLEQASNADGPFSLVFSSPTGAPDRVSPRELQLTRDPGTYYFRVRASVNGAATDSSNVASVTVAQPTSTTISVVPAADNMLLYSTTNPAAMNTVFRTAELAVGCNWAVGPFSSDWICAGSALKFDLPQIAGKTIVSAKLLLHPYMLPADDDTRYAVNAFAASWSPTSITFSNQPNYFTSGGASIDPPFTTATPVEFDVKTIVQNWANGTWTNHGFVIRDTQLVVPSVTSYRATAFYSTDMSSTRAPRLIVEYR